MVEVCAEDAAILDVTATIAARAQAIQANLATRDGIERLVQAIRALIDVGHAGACPAP